MRRSVTWQTTRATCRLWVRCESGREAISNLKVPLDRTRFRFLASGCSIADFHLLIAGHHLSSQLSTISRQTRVSSHTTHKAVARSIFSALDTEFDWNKLHYEGLVTAVFEHQRRPPSQGRGEFLRVVMSPLVFLYSFRVFLYNSDSSSFDHIPQKLHLRDDTSTRYGKPARKEDDSKNGAFFPRGNPREEGDTPFTTHFPSSSARGECSRCRWNRRPVFSSSKKMLDHTVHLSFPGHRVCCWSLRESRESL